jgi:hypothetical protein
MIIFGERTAETNFILKSKRIFKILMLKLASQGKVFV